MKSRIAHLGSGVRVLGFALGLSSLSSEAIAGTARELPPELTRLGRLNTEALGRLRTCSGMIDLFTSEALSEGELAYGNIYTVWVKGRKVREDRSAAAGARAGKRRLPLKDANGIHVGEIGESDSLRTVRTPEAIITYEPGTKLVTIVAGDPMLPYGRNASKLHFFAQVLDRTLEEKIRQCAEQGYLPSVSESSIEGLSFTVLTWEFPGKVELRVFLSPSQGHMVTKVQHIVGGAVYRQVTIRLREYHEGVFWFERAEHEWFREPGKGVMKREVAILKRLEVAAQPDERLFTLEGMDVPPGCRVLDRRLGLSTR